MNLQDLPRIADLKRDLEYADDVLAAFKAAFGDTVRCVALSMQNGSDKARSVELPAIPKATAIELAQAQRTRVIEQLALLGISVE